MAIDNIQDGNKGSVVRGILNQVINWINGQPKVYRAFISQTGTDAPTAIVLENTFPTTPTYSYSNTGRYLLAFPSGTLTIDKTTSVIANTSASQSVSANRVSDIAIAIQSGDFTQLANDLLSGNFIEIKVYGQEV